MAGPLTSLEERIYLYSSIALFVSSASEANSMTRWTTLG